MSLDKMGPTLDEVSHQVAVLSRAIHEITFWMAEVEKSGVLPEGLAERARDRAHLHRLERRIDSIRQTLESTKTPQPERRDILRENLEKSLDVLEGKADVIRGRLVDA